ncbi:hypothetical protein ANCCAN_10505 [Ancylostoma caninum]|uniref:Late embryogeneis abundant protein n=1 Tax=Ancylostoma caninum TaxID=29170 RepID=A0A368GKS7_ANCCA|nr:hypothetical protein ANCCAN_10505 [Ancylostoma caninum]
MLFETLIQIRTPKMMHNSRILVQSSKRLLTCMEAQGLHYGPSPQNGIIRDASKKVQEVAEKAADVTSTAGQKVKETVQSGYETLVTKLELQAKQAGTSATEAVKGTFQSGYDKMGEKGENAREAAEQKLHEGKRVVKQKAEDAKDYVSEKMEEGAEAMKHKK